MKNHEPNNPLQAAERDIIALGIAVAAIIMLVGTGGTVLPKVMDALFGNGARPDVLLVNALLLNIALIIFGWRRYRELTREIEERRRAEARAQLLAATDPLTQCLNRRSMLEATEELRSRAAVRGEAVAYCMMDLDNFKQINDMHGHPVGDAVLVMLSERVRGILPRDARLARLGGDEFAFVMPYPAGHADRVDDLVIRLFESLAQPFRLPTITVELTLSIGLAADHDADGTIGLVVDAGTLMQRADMALYHAKKQGRNRYFWFEPSMESEMRFRNQLETGIRRGLARGEFVPFYEQQVDVESGALVGFEMLARWRSPQLGVISPDIFVPIAEEIGLINEMSERLMEQAFADAREWDDSLTLSINISPVQLRDPWFAQRLLKKLVAAGFPPQRLEIEITESCLHENIGLVRSMIMSLRNQGVQISLDDFGTGYSSLEQLRNLPFDRIKIDRSFVSELREPGSRSRIVEAIISLGRGLDLPLTAEGVEDEQILQALKSMGRLKAQGYLYGLPEDAEAVRARLKAAGKLTGVSDQAPSLPRTGTEDGPTLYRIARP
ncbi:diguanylate cyclase (GGDEF)-like protein [Erythromicrobium ramosum]|uniref:Diguanylate cyclase (GGDEF)-like protein n=1 Tax=Erythrobacter ramosus TaxID=35811 RepID=A0A6I4UHE9_9SPHN|nr:EAL domain-containing protein [Erythrobacter ramosus]MBB3776378.1 diguanylate cyclase (GGDEF)-like protein [Erythrobacter ramosus]MXP38541.1 EAL domain-containing protein [Erythrobacter ramosus]